MTGGTFDLSHLKQMLIGPVTKKELDWSFSKWISENENLHQAGEGARLLTARKPLLATQCVSELVTAFLGGF